MTHDSATIRTKKDFASDTPVKWCPGCGDYAILASLQSALATLGVRTEDTVIISGIGCSGRLPYYMSTFGFHTLHGRAPAVATGLKLARPELSVWVIVGDGDGLSIGANHLLHLMRRNLNINILLVNNQIYGLTKGQFSPTSAKGKKTGTSPLGSLENPVNPILFALLAGASFVARSVDTDKQHLEPLLAQAHAHPGCAFIEILQNCHVFNDGVFAGIRDKKNRDEEVVFLENQQPLVFGHTRQKAICCHDYALSVEAVSAAELPSNIVIHNASNPGLALLLAQLSDPVPLGIFKRMEAEQYDAAFNAARATDFASLQRQYEAEC